jgi:hypothetical protein
MDCDRNVIGPVYIPTRARPSPYGVPNPGLLSTCIRRCRPIDIQRRKRPPHALGRSYISSRLRQRILSDSHGNNDQIITTVHYFPYLQILSWVYGDVNRNGPVRRHIVLSVGCIKSCALTPSLAHFVRATQAPSGSRPQYRRSERSDRSDSILSIRSHSTSITNGWALTPAWIRRMGRNRSVHMAQTGLEGILCRIKYWLRQGCTHDGCELYVLGDWQEVVGRVVVFGIYLDTVDGLFPLALHLLHHQF